MNLKSWWRVMFPRYETVNLPPFESPMDFSYMSDTQRGESKLATQVVNDIVDDFSAEQQRRVNEIIDDLASTNRRRRFERR